MLPWKRHKFELLAADEERRAPPPPPPSKARGQCPAGAAEGALSRVGGLFRRRRRTFRVSGEAPAFSVLYLGNAATLQAKGEGCTDAAVGRIWARSEAGRLGARMRLTVGPQGLRLAPAEAGAGPRPGHLYLLHRVTYCVADPRLPRLFAWVYRHEARHKAVLLRCHAALLSRPEKARALALLLFQTSAAALAEFRRLKRRADARHQQLQQAGRAADGALPLVPLRRLLLRGPAGCYKPPAERGRAAPRLGPISEDSLGEELEARAHAGPPPEEDGGWDEPEGAAGEPEACSGEDDDDDELLLPPAGPGREAAAGPGLGRLIRGLGALAIGNDVELLRADLRVTRLLSGDSTGSESSIDSSGRDGGSPPPPEPDSG
ncbi:protein FAM43A-like [Tiliqua scincoides]|uniref:protein FAM43A-like n=1 Tax=Tiliqua scincoides TaxID=71010 RepID=UPI003463556B